MLRHGLVHLLASLVMLLGVNAVAHARTVHLNGANIDSLRNQVFENARVEIDAEGNIRITMPLPSAPPPPQGPPPPPPAAAVAPAPPVPGSAPAPASTPAPVPTTVSKRYWLVTEKAQPGLAQYDVDMFVNGKWVRKFLDIEDHLVMEITSHLKPGNNTVTFVARKKMGSARRSQSPQHFFRIVIGEGNEGGRNVMISRKMIDYRRTAFETEDFKNEYPLVAQ